MCWEYASIDAQVQGRNYGDESASMKGFDTLFHDRPARPKLTRQLSQLSRGILCGKEGIDVVPGGYSGKRFGLGKYHGGSKPEIVAYLVAQLAREVEQSSWHVD